METAVTKVYNDLLLAADEGDVSTLCLLDLTAVLDTALTMTFCCFDHNVSLVSSVLFSSGSAHILSDRTFQIVYGGSTSSVVISSVLCRKVLFWARVCLSIRARPLSKSRRPIASDHATAYYTHSQ